MEKKEWSRTARYIALTALVAGVLALAYLGRELIRPLIISALLAYVLNPLVSFVADRSRLHRSLVVSLLYLGILLVLIGLIIALLPALREQLRLLVLEFAIISTQLSEYLNRGITLFGYSLPLADGAAEDLPEQIIEPELIIDLLGTATANLVWVVFVIVTTFYLLQDWTRLRDWVLRLPPPRLQGDARRLYEQTKVVWQGYLRGQLLLSIIIGVLTAISLAGVGLPAAGAIGLAAGALDFIPTIGPAVAMGIAALIAWFTGSAYLPLSNAWFTLVVIGLFAIIQALENVWLRPAIMGRSVRMHPAVVFVAIIGALSVAGVIGALVVVPVLGTLGIFGRYLRCRFLEIDPWPDQQLTPADLAEELPPDPLPAAATPTLREEEATHGPVTGRMPH